MTLCGQKCVDFQTDSENCGTCGNPCAGGEVCTAGACVPQCAGGANCYEGLCVPSCPGTTVPCNGACADVQNDPSNCGTCGNACGTGMACLEATCVDTCSGQTDGGPGPGSADGGGGNGDGGHGGNGGGSAPAGSCEALANCAYACGFGACVSSCVPGGTPTAAVDVFDPLSSCVQSVCPSSDGGVCSPADVDGGCASCIQGAATTGGCTSQYAACIAQTQSIEDGGSGSADGG